MSVIATVNLGSRQRYTQMNKLLYLSDGLNQPKMYDGISLVNWGITAPSTSISLSATSSGSNVLDTCETAWTPVSLLTHDGETAFTLVPGIINSMVSVSSTAKVGSLSSLLLMGYASEPISSSTALMLHFNGLDGATSTTDDSPTPKSITINSPAPGDCELDTAQKVFGTSSLYCKGGVGVFSYISVLPVADFEFDRTTTDFTLDCRVRFASHSGSDAYIVHGSSNTSSQAVGLTVIAGGTGFKFAVGSSFSVSKLLTVALNTWYHLRVCVAANKLYLFVDGILANAGGTTITSGTFGPYNGTRGAVTIGGINTLWVTAAGIRGWIDELRWEKGVAMSTADFVVPTSEYSNWISPGTSLTGVTGMAAYKNITPVDYSGYYGIQFWIRSLVPLSPNDVSLLLCDSNAGVDILETANCPSVPANQWTLVTHKFVTPSLLTSVASIALSINRDLGQNGIYIDDVRCIRCLCTIDSSLFTQGGASVRLDVAGNTPDNVLLAYRDFPAVNMVSDTIVMASVRSDKTFGTQQLQYVLDDTAGCSSPLELLYFPDLMASGVFNDVQFTLANPLALGAVVSHGIKLVKNNLTPCTIWIDNIRRAVSTSGNLSGRYFVWSSFYSSKYDRESDLSPISSVVDCVGQAISLSSIPISADPQVDMRRIYRSAAGGTVPYLDSTIADNSTTSLVLNKSDASILAAIRHPSLAEGLGKFAPPPAAPYMVQFKNRIVMAGSIPYNRGTVTATNASATFTFTSAQLDDSFIGRYLQIIGDSTNYVIISINAIAKTCVARPIYDLVSGTYSGVTGGGKTYYITSGSENTIFTSYVDDDDVPRPHGFPIEFAQDITEGIASDTIRGLGLVGDSISAMKRFSTHLLEGNYPPFSVSKISSVIGCVSHDTIVQDENDGAIWLAGEQGVAYCNGSGVSIISDKIQDIFSGGHALSLNRDRFQYAHAVYDTKNKRYYLFCSSETSSINDVCIVLDKISTNQNEWNWYYFVGIEASCSTVIYSTSGVGSIYIGDYDGFQSKLNIGWSDGVQIGTLSGTPTGGTPRELIDTGASFYTTGDGLKKMSIMLYDPITGVGTKKKVLSNTSTAITIENSIGWLEVAPKLNGATLISSLVVFNNKIYGGSELNGRLLEWDGVGAWVLKAPQLGTAISIKSMVVFNGKIYGGTSPNGNLYEWDGVNAWVSVAAQLPGETGIYGLAVLNNKIYGATVPNGKLLEWDGVSAWIEKAPTPAIPCDARSLVVYNNKLYTAGNTGGRLYEWDGIGAWVLKSQSLGGATCYTLAVHNNKIYGTRTVNGTLYEWDGINTWVLVASQYVGETTVRALVTYRGSLYGGSGTTGLLLRWDGVSSWVLAAASLGAETAILSTAVFNDTLYGGTTPNAKLYKYDVSSGWPINPSPSYKYYIGYYDLDWKSKQFELLRPTDKKMLLDAVLNNYKLVTSQKMRIQLLKNLGASQIATQLRDLSVGEEQVLLVRERVSQAQWQISGFVHGQNIQIVSLGLRLKGHGVK